MLDKSIVSKILLTTYITSKLLSPLISRLSNILQSAILIIFKLLYFDKSRLCWFLRWSQLSSSKLSNSPKLRSDNLSQLRCTIFKALLLLKSILWIYDEPTLSSSRYLKCWIPCKYEILSYFTSLTLMLLTASSSAWLKLSSPSLSILSFTYCIKLGSGKFVALTATSPASACTMPIPNGRLVKKMIKARTKPKIFVFLIFINFISFLI